MTEAPAKRTRAPKKNSGGRPSQSALPGTKKGLLTPMQQKFAEAYFRTRNRREAVEASGSKTSAVAGTSYAMADRMLKLPQVIAYLRELEKQAQADVAQDASYYVNRLCEWANTNITDIVDIHPDFMTVTLKKDIPRERWNAVQSIKVDKDGRITEVKLIDKLKSLTQAATILGIAVDPDTQKNPETAMRDLLNLISAREQERGLLPAHVVH